MDNWQAGYRAALSDLVLSKGSAVHVDEYGEPNLYGWQDARATDHVRGTSSGLSCPVSIGADAVVTEEEYGQFGDTFNGDVDHAVAISEVSCSCGHYAGPWAHKATLSSILVDLLG